MRVKCPNSEIVLELPGDKTDMKFTCPACHKIHRVTVTITTPGETPPPAAAHSVMRASAAMPKKYATGAYAPVVDIPIDANFVLLDESSVSSQGIDLGAAAPGRRPEPEFEPAPKPAPDPDPEPESEHIVPPENRPTSGSGRMMWDDMRHSSPSAQDDETVGDDDDGDDDIELPADEPAADPRPERGEGSGGGIAKGILFLLLLAALAAAAYLGYQQYAYGNARKLVEDFLGRAENSLREGDIPASADAAREAGVVLADAEEILTPAKAYNRLADATGLFAPAPARPAREDPLAERIGRFTEREERLTAFTRDLDASDVVAMAAQLRDALGEASVDAPLAAAMERAAIAAAAARLDADAGGLAPEQARARARADGALLAPVLSEEGGRALDNELSAFLDRQRRRMADDVRAELSGIVQDAGRGEAKALERYRALAARLKGSGIPEFGVSVASLGGDAEQPALEQLAGLAGVVDEAVAAARSVLSREGEDDDAQVDELVARAKEIAEPNPAMAEAAAALVDDTRAAADELLSLRVDVMNRMQSEMRRGREYTGTRLAWAMLRTAFGDGEVQIDPAGFSFDSRESAMRFSVGGIPAVMKMSEDDYERRVRAVMNGYSFTAGWALLFHRPVAWMADLARGMRDAGVDSALYPNWEVVEGPEGPAALSVSDALGVSGASANASLSLSDANGRLLFFGGRLFPVDELPRPENTDRVDDDFRLAAQSLEKAVMEDGTISQQLRQALKPVLTGTYERPDPRDYFDSAFCRNLIEADYLERAISPMPPEIQFRLDSFREALERLENGYDEFKVDLGDGRVLFATVRPEGESGGNAGDQDPETGETRPRYSWRVETPTETVFHSTQPARFIYAFMLAEHYDGRHTKRPDGLPALTEVRHATKGLVASYKNGAERAEGNAELWNAAIAEDSSGRFDPSAGEPGWSYPLHVLQRDGNDNPVLLATLSGTVESPDFSAVALEEERRRAEEEWLDGAARTLSTPGELGLIFHQFFRYCSDSPLPELPNLIGSHFGLSDTHQTVYETLERRWVGRLIGDCDDLAEFFQVLTRRQGKLSHVMQLPGHAAAGYVEKDENGNCRFVVLQTGPVLQFTAPTLNEAVEYAYRSFDRGDGMSHMTTDAVPLLLRFANEETRTPFVLSARIFEDAEYADTMIRVQSYWHEHVYSAAIKTMEELVAEDKEIGNIKELGSLYERVGFYDKSEELRRSELEMVRDNPQASLSTLLEIVQLHFQDRNREKALTALGEMEDVMLRMIRNEDAPEFFRNMTFRSYWAMFLSRLGQPARAWNLVRYDVAMTKRQLGRVAEPVLRTLVVMYDRMCMERDKAGGQPGAELAEAMDTVRGELEDAFQRGYFSADDSYNGVIGKYFFLGRYAVADAGREKGLEELRRDGPYPAAAKDQTKRSRGIGEEDWSWFRITPQLYHVLASEMLDEAEYPELYDPEAARPILEDVARAVEKGTGLGSDVAGGDDVVTAELTLAFLKNDLAAFRAAMATVREKNYSSLYDDAALTFGQNCGLAPLADFPAWAEAFHEFFPGRQHYFKVVYRAIDKGHYDHALAMAEATARFFSEYPQLAEEAAFVRSIVPDLKNRKALRRWMQE